MLLLIRLTILSLLFFSLRRLGFYWPCCTVFWWSWLSDVEWEVNWISMTKILGACTSLGVAVSFPWGVCYGNMWMSSRKDKTRGQNKHCEICPEKKGGQQWRYCYLEEQMLHVKTILKLSTKRYTATKPWKLPRTVTRARIKRATMDWNP